MKKRSLLSILLAALLVFSLGLNALAAGSDNNASDPSDNGTAVEDSHETDNSASEATQEDRNEAQIAEEIQNLEENGTVSVSGSRPLRTDELRQIAEKNGGLSVSVANASWHFNSITNPDIEFNPRMTVGGEHSDITQKLGNVEGIVVSIQAYCPELHMLESLLIMRWAPRYISIITIPLQQGLSIRDLQ